MRTSANISNSLGETLAATPSPAPDLATALREAVVILVQLVAPMMPHLAEECWRTLDQPGLISEAAWPRVERDLLVESTVTLPVQVNGKKRGEITVARSAENPEIEAAVLALDAVKQALDGRAVRKLIVVPQRIVNVVGYGRVSRRLLLVSALALPAAGCFQPMYAAKTDGSPALRERLAGVDLPPVTTREGSREARLGVEIRNMLAFKLYGTATGMPPTHRLELKLFASKSALIVDPITALPSIEITGSTWRTTWSR